MVVMVFGGGCGCGVESFDGLYEGYLFRLCVNFLCVK